jgi:hypothetical protein
MEEFADVMTPVPPVLPPLRAINHEINLIDPGLRIAHHVPKCPESLRQQLLEKIERYTKAGWWIETSVQSAAPMLCIPKKDGRLRTVIDAQKHNDNTVKDMTPLPDMEQIRHDLAKVLRLGRTCTLFLSFYLFLFITT